MREGMRDGGGSTSLRTGGSPAGVLQHYILIQEGDMQAIVFARGGAEKYIMVAESAEKEQNSLFWILLHHLETE